MAWNRAFPQNTTKIRLTPAGLQANWDAIEFGLVPYDHLRLEGQAVAPSRIALHGFVYTRDTGSGIVELFYEDDQNPAVITQITKNGRLGIDTQGVNASNLIMDSTSFTYAKNQLIVAKGHVSSAGTLSGAVNISTASRTDEGQYTVNIAADALLNSNYAVIVTCNRVGDGNARVPMVIARPAPVAATVTAVKLRTASPTSDADTDSSFDIIVVGGR